MTVNVYSFPVTLQCFSFFVWKNIAIFRLLLDNIQ